MSNFKVIKTNMSDMTGTVNLVNIQIVKDIPGFLQCVVCVQALCQLSDVDAVTRDLMNEAIEYFS